MKLHPAAGRTARYTIVGGICAVGNNVVMILGDLAGINYVPMSVISFLLITPLGYFLHSSFTFKKPFSFGDFVRFFAGVATGFPLYFVIMAILCTGLRLPVIVAVPAATIILFLWNFASAHWAIRRRWRLH